MKRVSEVSRLAGVSRRTLQYYDDEGLIMAERSKDNYRLYDDAALERVWKILVYREMEIELKDIRHLLELSDTERNVYLQNLIEEMEEKIVHLKDQTRFIHYIQTNGIPFIPSGPDAGGKTYVEHIACIKTELNKSSIQGGNGHEKTSNA